MESIVAAFSLVLGTATPGGGFPVYGAAFTEVLNAQEPRLRLEARNTKGSAENVPLLEAGKLDLGLVAGEFASAIMAKPDTKLHIVAAMYSSPGLFIVKGDSPVRSMQDLRGRPVVLGTQGSGVTVLGRNVLDSLGIEINPIVLEKAADGPPMLLDGRAAALWGAGVGWPAFGALAKQGGRFIAPNSSEIALILKKNPQLQAVTLPAKSYAGQDAPIPSVGSWSFVFARPDLPEQAGYLLARAIHQAESKLAAKAEQARETTMANTLAAAPRAELLHPGVRRYLAEAGIR
jgi:TRAP transporter TAXI family solute receptor